MKGMIGVGLSLSRVLEGDRDLWSNALWREKKRR